ncbi:hypothetical protein CJF42_24755 [Pseudoalteromonas sp. NBT06-2]|uniref:hypothetical protein n=1 Tax=Pseudoalteromonas sp. NBT06-2 TaxID=2025950 RepID=UPI000BA6050C|nr:hypothetical protein [Pseudoalteromonas sp. NBT06-2]PAJ71805.1 hypothetical protein CJF42_24755 [Pseudoalteromonas sp. NBT06-2]
MKKLTLSLLVLLSANSFAQEVNTQALKACSMIENDFKRLVCYDQIIAGKSIDVSNVKMPIKTEQKKVESKTDKFGLEHKNISVNAEKEQVAAVKKVKESLHGELIVTLTNGQVWRQLGTNDFRVKADNEVIIMRGALNSFLLKKMGSNKTIRVKRVK